MTTVLFYAAVIGLAHSVIYRVAKPTFEKIVKGQDDPELKEKYVEKSCDCACKFFVNGSLLIWGMSILADSKWLPWQMGGTLTDFQDLIVELPFTPEEPGTREFGMVCLGLYTY